MRIDTSRSEVGRLAANTVHSQYPMARHGLALDLPLSSIYLMKYSVPDCGVLRPFALGWNMKAADNSSTVG